MLPTITLKDVQAWAAPISARLPASPGSTLTYTDTTISSGTVYNYRVRAQDSSGTFSPYSNCPVLSPIMPYVVSGFAGDSWATRKLHGTLGGERRLDQPVLDREMYRN